MKKIKFYIDMDGVLARWNENASEEETHEKGYFLRRQADYHAVKMVQELKKKGCDVCILSSVYTDDHSADDKHQWLKDQGLGKIDAIFVPYGESKHKFINSDNTLPVLVDDYGKNLLEWKAQGYFPIKYYNGVNNRPKLKVSENGEVSVLQDSWYEASIDHRQDGATMASFVMALAEASNH